MTRRRPDRSSDAGSSIDTETGLDPDADLDSQSLEDLVADLASTLRETEELPVAPAASIWLGEAHAVAENLTHGELDGDVIHERVGHVHRLLTSAGDLDNDDAAAHVTDALTLATTILERTDGDGGDGEAQS